MNIADYMDHLTADPSARTAFRADPTGEMTKFGLSEADQAVVMTRDPVKIRAAIAKVDPARAQSIHITF